MNAAQVAAIVASPIIFTSFYIYGHRFDAHIVFKYDIAINLQS